LVALVPDDDTGPVCTAEPVEDRVLALARDFAGAVGLPCAIGTGTGRAAALADAFARARAVSRVAPIQNTPRHVHTLPDVFVELGVAEVPQIDAWLGDLADQLSHGPDLIGTLDAYYRSDMNRLITAASLNIHPRTLDYRLQRARDISGVSPGSTRGVRILSTAVARALAAT
jgi:sugar diacid utilization regulator